MKLALPNKGSLAEESMKILKEAGYKQRNDSRDLILFDVENSVEFYYLRPRDIALYVGNGEIQLGITGRDLLIDSKAKAEEILQLGFGYSTFQFATDKEKVSTPTSGAKVKSLLSGKRVATAYPGLVSTHLEKIGITAEIVRLDGAVESSIKLGVADVIADVVSTGNTLRQAGLKVFGETILESEAILIKRIDAPLDIEAEVILRRLQGVVIARQYVLVDYDVKRNLLDTACAITPGFESPTISPLAKADWVAVRAMVPRREINRIMDELWILGARGILVTDIHACRL